MTIIFGYHLSTTVEIILYYLTFAPAQKYELSTTVEIILYYLTKMERSF